MHEEHRTTEERLEDHMYGSLFRGSIEEVSTSASRANHQCGDAVTIHLKLNDAKPQIEQARFEGTGCLISQAAASILCEWIEHRPLEEVRAYTAESFLQKIGLALSVRRRNCALLSFFTLQDLLDDLETDQEMKSAS